MARSSAELRNRRRGRGAAMVEAVVALPFFVLLFVSTLWVRDRSLAQQQAQNHSRMCAWLYSANACTHTPPGCEDMQGGDFSAPELRAPDLPSLPDMKDFELDDLGGLVTGQVNGLEVSADGGFSVGGDLLVPVVMNVLAPVIEALIGSSVGANARRYVTRPALYGGGQLPVSGSYNMACNLRPQSLGDVALDAFKALWPF